MLSALRTAAGALTDLAEEAAPVLEAEKRGSDVPLETQVKKEGLLPVREEPTGLAREGGTPETPGVAEVATGVEEPPVSKAKAKKEDKDRKGKKKTVKKEKKQGGIEAKEEEREVPPSNPGGPSSGSGLNRRGDTSRLPGHEEVASNPSSFGLATIPRGSAGRHFADRHNDEGRGSAKPPEPRGPPPRGDRPPPPPAPPRRPARSRSPRRTRGSKGQKHRQRGRDWQRRQREQWRRREQ